MLERGLIGVEFITANGSDAILLLADIAGTTRAFAGVPASLLTASDLHGFLAVISDTGGSRVSEIFSNAAGNPTVPVGPTLAKPTLTFTLATPYLRPRAQVAVQPEYASELEVIYSQASPPRSASVLASAAYAAPAGSWDLTVPDLTAAGFDVNLGLKANTKVTWTAQATGGATYLQLVGRPSDGSMVRSATRGDTVSAGAVHTRVWPTSLVLDVQRARTQGEHLARP